MKYPIKLSLATACGLAAVMAIAGSALAQGPQFRDERTGKMWTPDIVSQDDAPQSATAYPDKAFDPRQQREMIPGVVQQRPRANLMGVVPITAGPNVPIVSLDAPSLQAIPGRHWLTVLYVTNNSAGSIDVVVGCEFTNGGRKVQETRVLVPPAGPGERLGLGVRGPQTDLFVDRVTCEVLSPI